MSVRRMDVIDMLRVERGTGGIVLDLINEEDWEGEKGHLLALQEKLHSYLGFIESGQVYQWLAAEGVKVSPGELPIRVNVVAKM